MGRKSSKADKPDMETLALTQIVATGMLGMGKTSIMNMFKPIFFLTKWQQSPVAQVMLDYAPLIALLVEVILIS